MPDRNPSSTAQRFAALRRRIRRWMRPPRRIRFSRAGWFFSAGSVLLGVAAIGTGNNLLFLMLGGMLGFITLSGWLSEQMLRRLEVRRRVARATAGEPARITYELRNGNRRLPAFSVEAGEEDQEEARAWVPVVDPGAWVTGRAETVWEERGVYPLETITLSTSFPFGLFVKERDVEVPGEAIVWPRTDRRVREPRPAGQRVRRSGEAFAGQAGARGEYRGLRPYRAGDDPRDVHWKTTARVGEPVVREYERDRSRALWLCLDLRAPEGDVAEAAAEIAASLAAGAARRGDAFGLATQDARVRPGTGAAQLERVLDALARARFRADAGRLEPPVPAGECVLVAASSREAGWGEVFTATAATGGGR
ncbi:DUF58 domain-containing protein [Longimicrobium sp.]|uniref:DUF58 domain-containing protein n=1 Tax=Longimicrobium sp. TaxID=2029185 RepID=UPI002E3025BE|nr:DUF58 domain-containing protein [Longimicrobium sp.]HEX6040890.1 DUF58 domain-containing protein [Longimicrobium sp.]